MPLDVSSAPPQDRLLERPPFLGDQRRVGGDAVEDAHGIGLADFVQVGGINEEFHGYMDYRRFAIG